MGVDAGGTKTRARLVNPEGITLGEGLSGPANSQLGREAVLASIEEASRSAISAANVELGGSRLFCGIGIAGFSRQGFAESLPSENALFERMTFTSDGVTANLGAHAGGDGAIIIVGTGSFALGNRGTEFYRMGGYGFPISDQGSGADMGLQACRRALQALDGQVTPTAMTREIWRHIGSSRGAIVDWADQMNATKYAAFAPIVLGHADLGDPHAMEIVKSAATSIEGFIHAVMAKGDHPRCCLMGGLAGPMLRWLSADAQSLLVEPLGDALSGCVHLAQTLDAAEPILS